VLMRWVPGYRPIKAMDPSTARDDGEQALLAVRSALPTA
jgi:hypothetical protein